MNCKLSILLFIASFFSLPVLAQSNFMQKMHLGVFAAASMYKGSLPEADITPGGGVAAAYEIVPKVQVRFSVFLTELSAKDDKLPNFGPDTRQPAYYFKSNLNEASLTCQYEIFDLNAGKKITPYLFAGVALYDYKPYQKVAYRNNRNDLRYANLAMQLVEDVSQQRLAIPAGIGLKYAISPNSRIFAEGNYRFINNKALDNYMEDGKSDSYYSFQIGLLFRLSKINVVKGIKGKNCNCPVY